MSYYRLSDGGDVSICYVRAWDDNQWRSEHGLLPKTPKSDRPSKTEQRRLSRLAPDATRREPQDG